MKRSYRILPVYTGDVSGACSALYELGGMVVIHDPSGCNSTYNTHDETRWYDRDSLIFITALTDTDAILGNDDKLVRDVVEAAMALRPAFIALCNSPIPFINGTDFPALCRLIEKKTGIPCFYVPTNGMHDYTVGAGLALRRIAERFVTPAEKRDDSLNILGVTPLDFGIKASPEAMRGFAEDAGFSVVSCWAMGDGLAALSRAAQARVNLVVSAAGLPAAEYLYERFGTPYVTGIPIGGFADTLSQALHMAARTGECRYPSRDARASSDGSISAVGEPIIMGSLAAVVEAELDMPVRLVCPLETPRRLLGEGDIAADGEEELEAALRGASLVIADPFYEQVLPEGARLAEIPHQAFSGRNGWKDAVSLTELDVRGLLAKAD